MLEIICDGAIAPPPRKGESLSLPSAKAIAKLVELTHSARSATVEWGFQLLEQRLEQQDFVSVRKS